MIFTLSTGKPSDNIVLFVSRVVSVTVDTCSSRHFCPLTTGLSNKNLGEKIGDYLTNTGMGKDSET